MRDSRSLKVWQKAHQVARGVYRVSRDFPSEERFGIISQIQRASLSIPTNIAEGCGYDTNAEFRRYLKIAMGSASETEYLLLFAHEEKYLDELSYQQLSKDVVEVKKMLATFIKRLS